MCGKLLGWRRCSGCGFVKGWCFQNYDHVHQTACLQVESMSELRVSMRRLGAFLALPEPPEPWHARSMGGAPPGESADAGKGQPAASGVPLAVEVAGADFDWADRSWAQPADDFAAAAPGAREVDPAGPEGPSQSTNGTAAASSGIGFQLRDLRLSASRGQLVAIVGAVGSGE